MTDSSVKAMVEAIAWWRLDVPNGRAVLISAAVDLLLSGNDSPAVMAMASLYPDEGSFRIDQLVGRVVAELGISPALSEGEGMIVVRRMCRLVVDGEMSERNLSQWVHSQFHHQSDSDLLNDLAVLDDDYDQAKAAQVGPIRSRIRDVAEQILAVQE